MRTLLLLILISLVSCNNLPRTYRVYIGNGTGWETSSSYIDCDSVTMVTKTHARIYVDGKETHIYADRILVSN